MSIKKYLNSERTKTGRLLFSIYFGILSLVTAFQASYALDLEWDSGKNSNESANSEAARSECPQFFVQGTPPQILNVKLVTHIRLLCFSSFAVAYSPVSRTPLWSAEHLSRESLGQARGLKRVNDFHEEERLPVQERAYLSDYAHSGFDRGHMSPSADQPSEQAHQESFSLANMVPQNPSNNRHLWEGIESATRTWAKSKGELYVITGPLFIGTSVQQLHGRVMVPTHLFKIIYDPAKRAASAYLVLNQETEEYSVVSLEDLSKIAGINFIPTLSASEQMNKIELPKPTPHNERAGSQLGSDSGVVAQRERVRHDRHIPETQYPDQAPSEFRQVEHLLKEMAHLLN